jgi:hypothetical protein
MIKVKCAVELKWKGINRRRSLSVAPKMGDADNMYSWLSAERTICCREVYRIKEMDSGDRRVMPLW